MNDRLAEPIALFDLDGTLADYDAAMRRDMLALQAPSEEPWVREPETEIPAHLQARMDLIRKSPGWWTSLERYQPGFDVLSVARELKYRCHVLTKGPKNATNSWTEKVLWCREHVPDCAITVTQDKGLVYGKVLVDDWPSYVKRWLKWRVRGLVIMPAHPWNEGFEHENVLRYRGQEDLGRVRDCLASIRLTCRE